MASNIVPPDESPEEEQPIDPDDPSPEFVLGDLHDEKLRKFDFYKPRLEEIERPCLEELTRMALRLRGVVHEELGEASKLEVAFVWLSLMDSLKEVLKANLRPRLMRLYNSALPEALPLPIAHNIPIPYRAACVTKTNLAMTELLKEEMGLDINRDKII